MNEKRVELLRDYQRRVGEAKETIKAANDTRLEMSQRLNKTIDELVLWLKTPTSKSNDVEKKPGGKGSPAPPGTAS
ncbi:hypothetical protein KFL_003830090 [Klebsormidium nitens]|uniref:Uncharacterized protein n=1 Tax=Klebsormidium nitens TaxID=105231 RepID=A0A1Y1IAA7_KLENI|nr:hypothetical protein KFL_003830090 [Klebsormidium nitens]|eukprot:GAQ87860.1 hypothetical protein KFL_003830090 [Klebsormidium nitens]